MTPGQLVKIEAAAAAAMRLSEVGVELGLTDAEWRALVRHNREAVALAVARGRVLAQLRINARLIECSRRGNTDATIWILREWFGWKVKPREIYRRRR